MSLRDFEIEGVWSGRYFYRKVFGFTLMRPVQFYAVFERNEDGIQGHIYEPNTFGRRSAEHLEADVLNLDIGPSPSPNGGRVMRFRKQYNGAGGVRHGIDYEGGISQDGSRIEGTWRIGWLSSGTFELAKENPEQAEQFHSKRAAMLETLPRKTATWPACVVGGVILTVLLSSLWFMRLSPEARDARQFLSEMPEERIVEIRIEPNGQNSPAATFIHIVDRKRIAELAAAFRAATGVSPNHPHTQWSVIVRFITPEREYGGHVSQTANQGVLFWYSSGVIGGWNYGTYRNDALGPLIQQLIQAPRGE
jgi:hypothetical protein